MVSSRIIIIILLSISMLALCSSRLPESSDFGGRNTKIDTIVTTVTSDTTVVISKVVNKTSRR